MAAAGAGCLGVALVEAARGADTAAATGNANWTLTPTGLKSHLGGALTLAGVEQGALTGGPGNHALDASTFTGTTFLTGQGGNDLIRGGTRFDWLVEAANVNFSLTNTRLTGLGTDTLASINGARLTGGPGNNVLDASLFTGTTWLTGQGGNDVIKGGKGFDWLVESADSNLTLANTRLTGQGTDTLSSVNGARLTGGAGNNTFNVTGWTGQATLDGGAGADVVVSVNNANFTLTATKLTRSTGGSFTLTSVEVARLTGGAGNNVIDAGAFLGQAPLSGGAGNDTLKEAQGESILLGGAGNDTLVGGNARDLLFGGEGADSLAGGGLDDLLIHGTTRSDASWAQLAAIQAEWLRTDLDAAGRIAHLRSGGGLNGGARLNATTVLDDAFRDLLRGGAGADWLWRRLPPGVADALLDRAAEDAVI